eukprot:CAMPEP_0185025682 /NCGR_PEP_ID=MMETSP1103-20130426/8783_1 /TAXON_ID=36769 /ORGANISM="Paraphysomonas bandaiensis, Strain Caron Lab Isolate" /LENGTH=332 /DNA_ID=CAMNT_0027558951 /DNA_START=184 /DNA_END=1179 /DNA_ORIENTATION=+
MSGKHSSDNSSKSSSEEMINPVIFSRQEDDCSETTAETSDRTTDDADDKNKHQSSSASDKPVAVPYDSDIITQTDKDGKAKTVRMAAGTSHQKEADKDPVDDVSPPRYPLWKQLLCCFCRGTTNHRTRTTQLVKPPRISSPRSKRTSISGQTRLMGDPSPKCAGRKCLALDLDETLVHSSFQYVENADFVIPVTIEDVVHNVYVLKRPGVDEFMRRVGEKYEVVIYTASLSKYADPLLDQLDIHNVISTRLFRESCVYFEGHYVKDLSLLNRDISQCIIVDNSPMSYIFHPENAIDCGSFIDDPKDIEMWQIADFLEDLHTVPDVRGKTKTW